MRSDMKNCKPGCSISGDGLVLLTVVFVILKAFGKLDLSWWWVFAPIWIPACLAVLLVVVWLVATSK